MKHHIPAIALLLATAAAHAQMPTNMNYQGRVVDGDTLLSGSHTVTFRVFDAPAGGEVFYAENDSVVVDDGFYSTELGDNPAAEGSLGGGEPYFDDLAELFAHAEKYGQYWLELEVDGTTLSPREKILSTAFAMVAQEAMGVAHGSITSADIEDGAITSADIANRTIQPYDLSLSARSTLASADGSPDDALVVDGDGNVGIGTEHPGAGLQVDAGVELLAPELRSVMRDSDGTFTNLNGVRCTVVSGNYAYISSYNDDAITVVDVSNPDAPVLVTTLKHNVGGFNYLEAVTALVVDGTYLYAVSRGAGIDDGDGAINIISIADPAHPSLTTVLVDNVAGYNKLSYVYSICVHENHLYLPSSGEDAVTIVDISNPASPSLAAVLEDGSGSFTLLDGAYSVACEGDYAYIASFQDDSLTIADISTPTSPQFVAQLDGVENFNSARGVAVSGGYVYVAAWSSSQITVVDCRTPAAPVVAAAMLHGTGGFNYLHGIYDVHVGGNRLYASAYLSGAVTVIDISNPLSPQPLAELVDGVGGFDALDGARRVHAVGDRLYISSESASAVTIVDLDGTDGKAGLYVADRVGIGTPLPREALDVRGSIVASGDIMAGGDITAGVDITAGDDLIATDDVYIQSFAGGAAGRNVRMYGDGRLYAGSVVKYFSIPPCSFQPEYDSSSFGSSTREIASMTGGDLEMYAPVYLPDGAVVSEIKFYGYDNVTANLAFELRRQSISFTTTAIMASYTSAGEQYQFAGTDSTISYATIDNGAYSYHVIMYPEGGDWGGSLYCQGVSIRYYME
ncbi:MAG: hypothetical protein K9M45_11235 [Kiritimatiellales bacterium]|nr:hypothetical protein [Kiritimatiellales bacterium]